MPRPAHLNDPLIQSVALATADCPKDAPYLVGISGGRDSIALLHALRAASFENLTVAHFNHRLRGKNSDNDYKFVINASKEADLRIISDFWKPNIDKCDSMESAARAARYRFFAEAAASTSAQGIFLGHHADDQAETFLWNLLRGAGPAGMAAMTYRTEMQIDGLPLTVLRPLLGAWRVEIDACIARYGLKFREDATNRSLKYTRNRLRHQIIPWLEKKLGRNIRAPLWRAAEISRAEDEWLADLTAGFIPEKELHTASLNGRPLAWQRRTIHAWLSAQNVPAVGFVEIEAVRSLLDAGNSPARVNLPASLQARRRAGKITIWRQ